MSVEKVVDGIIKLIKKNIIAKTALISDANVGATTISVYDTFHFKDDEEIILIDDSYNTEGGSHYSVYEYAKIKHISSNTSITLYAPLESSWTTAGKTNIQKTIGHDPLYENNIYYGDREVIPTDSMAIAVEGSNIDTEWVYIQGGLNEDYKVKIIVYGKALKFEDGRRILDKYTYNILDLLNDNIHLDIDNEYASLVADVHAGETIARIADTPSNRAIFIATNLSSNPYVYQIQSNAYGVCGCGYGYISAVNYVGGMIELTMQYPFCKDYLMSDFSRIVRLGEYIYDSRATGAEFGVTPKGSAILRASNISWFGKKVNEKVFPQPSKSF